MHEQGYAYKEIKIVAGTLAFFLIEVCLYSYKLSVDEQAEKNINVHLLMFIPSYMSIS